MKIDRETGALVVGTLTTHEGTQRGVADGVHTWTILTRFANGRLAQLTLFADDAAFGESWDDYTEAKEQARRAVHDAAIEACLGPAHMTDEAHFSKEWTMPWGRVLSAHDPRGGATDVQIIYR